ncbi:uncharacterized protein LOC144878352 [Branchiostoma floridae x Branchiostoma japonicum]
MTMEVPDECRENWAGVRDRNRNPYFIRVATMCCYLQETIGDPAITGKNQADYAGHQGIIVFKDCDFETATGHVDLWDGADCCGQCYFEKCDDIRLYKCEEDTDETPTNETPTEEDAEDDDAIAWPPFRNLKNNYPDSTLSGDDIVEQEGLDAWLKGKVDNSCAIRASYAITKSGMTMEVPDECRENWAGVRDRNRNPYFIRVATMCCYLQETIGDPAITGKNQADYAGHQGIIVFKDCDFETATGHVDLWDGADCCGQCYFDKCDDIRLYKCEEDTDETSTNETPTEEDAEVDGAIEWPAFRDLKGNYPPPALTWDNIVDQEGLDAWLKNLANKNTCAMRVSYAITKSGMTMEVPDECRENWAGVRDRNMNPYFIRVATMCCYLQETIGAPAITGKNQADYAGHQGIIVFKDCDFETATGHVDLWDGADCCGQCYFDKCKDISLYKCE